MSGQGAPRPSRAFLRRARRAVRRMSPLQREVFFAMRFEADMTYAQLAARHRISEREVQRELALALYILSRSLREPERWWQRWYLDLWHW